MSLYINCLLLPFLRRLLELVTITVTLTNTFTVAITNTFRLAHPILLPSPILRGSIPTPFRKGWPESQNFPFLS